ncbi:MAG: PilW family protein [Gallionella sp.]|nr:PilW family protein [Gallionella sp.]MDD4945327.1 PilW family protein [Gallionella sp.]MDD5612674.1 PilW family protein [Gallionella sp.]
MEALYIRRHKGFTMVEMMVGLALGLLASLAIFTAVSSFETQRRITAGGADMQQNGLLALYFLEQDLRMAGFGLIDGSTVPGRLPCVKVNSVSVAPVSITEGGGSASDILTTHRLDSDTGGIVTGGGAGKLTSALSTINSITSMTVDTAQAIHLNDYLLIPDANMNCTQVKATSMPAVYAQTPGTPGTPATPAVPATRTTPAIPAQPAQPAVPGVPVVPVSTIINLGQSVPSFPAMMYSLDANFNLNHSDDGGKTWSPVAANIVNMQAQYGIANGGSQSVSCWTNASGSACGGSDWANPPAADINRIKAIRIAIVARSAQRAPNLVTTASPTWYGGAIDVSNIANWQNYRYKVYQTVIPVRNVIWGNL